jgi:hypothetical protein
MVDASALQLSNSVVNFSSELLTAVQLQMRESRFSLSELEQHCNLLREDVDRMLHAINSVQLADLASAELDSFDKTITQVHSLPPSTPSLWHHIKSLIILRNR